MRFLTILACKLLSFVGKLIGKGTSLPGSVALKLCPNILSRLQLPEHIIAITGSNGKTSTVEMIAAILRADGKTVVYNEEGSNQIEGVTTLVLSHASLSGKVNADVLLIESDERYASHSFKFFHPTEFVITNLYRDQLTRNGHPESVYDAILPAIHPDTKLIIIDTMQKIREVGGEAYSYASDYEIIGKLKQFADKHSICVLTVHHTRKQPAGDTFEMISGTTGLLGCADGSLLMQKKKRTSLEATIDVVGRDQQDQILYLSKDPNTQIWNLDKTETELHKEPPDPVLEAVARLVTSEQPEWTGSPSELAEALNTGMAANALTKYLNVKCGRLTDEYGIIYENKARHSGRRVTLTYTTK